MSNPFSSRFDSNCNECGNIVYEGEEMYADDGEFICLTCAEDRDIVCYECGAKKKPEFDLCYQCNQDNNETFHTNINLGSIREKGKTTGKNS